jgi:hypothetical protein
MLTRENNELICRVGPDTPMGKAIPDRSFKICSLRSWLRRGIVPTSFATT